MNPRTFGSSIWLLAVLAVTVLFIGAAVHLDTSNGQSNSAVSAPVTLAAPDNSASAPVATAPPLPSPAPLAPANLSPGLADIIKLAQSHVGEDTLLAFIETSGKTYHPTADEILYLYDLGVSDKIVSALVKQPNVTAAVPTTPAPAQLPAPVPKTTPPAPVEPSPVAATDEPLINPPPADLDTSTAAPAPAPDDVVPVVNPQDNYFYDSLSPYGSWVQLADGTWAWQPTVTSVNPDWQPYLDRGRWLSTDDGWYWASDYSWGWATFHYGRWSREHKLGWVWHPGLNWSPAWVAWRNSDQYVGWAPLPPGVLFQPGLGFVGVGLPGFEVSFGLEPNFFVFVSTGNLISRNLAAAALPPKQSGTIFKTTKPAGWAGNYSHVVNPGLPPEIVSAATGSPIRKYSIQETSSPDGVAIHARGATVAVFRPALNPATPPLKTSATARRERTPAYADTGYNSAFAPAPAAASVGDESSATFRPFPRPNSPAPAVASVEAGAPNDYRRPPINNAGYSGYNSRNYVPEPSTAAPRLEPPREELPRTESPHAAPSEPPRPEEPAEPRGSGTIAGGDSAKSSSSSSSSNSRSSGKN